MLQLINKLSSLKAVQIEGNVTKSVFINAFQKHIYYNQIKWAYKTGAFNKSDGRYVQLFTLLCHKRTEATCSTLYCFLCLSPICREGQGRLQDKNSDKTMRNVFEEF